MSYALPPRDYRRRTSRRRSQGVEDSFPREELLLLDSDKSESPILRSDDDNLIAKPIDDDAAHDDKTFSLSNSRLATRDDINNNCEVQDAQQASEPSIEQYGSRHHNLILSSVVGVAIIGVSMIEGRQQVVFMIVSIMAIIVTHNSLSKLIHNEGSRLSMMNRGLQSRWSSRNEIQSMPRFTFRFGLQNHAPATTSFHKTWQQLNTMTNNIITEPLLVKTTKSSSAVTPKGLTQLLEERKSSSSSILFESDSMTIKPPMQILERLEKRNRTNARREHKH